MIPHHFRGDVASAVNRNAHPFLLSCGLKHGQQPAFRRATP
jgi:hypothetical protein